MPLSNSRRVSTRGLAFDYRLNRYAQAWRYLWRVHVQSCLRRGLENRLTPDEFVILCKQPCRYCGSPPNNWTKQKRSREVLYNGIDRVDNQKPYANENLVACCKLCNSMKSSLTVTAFLSHIGRIVTHVSHFPFQGEALHSRFSEAHQHDCSCDPQVNLFPSPP